jgi:hypothetical protein
MVPHWPGNDVKVGQVGGVAVDNNKEVVIFHRGSRRWEYKYDISICYRTVFDLVLDA